jgi:hypothetical protein
MTDETLRPLDLIAKSDAARDNRRRVFDWDKAARLIVERAPKRAEAGLSEDRHWTADDIFAEGAPRIDSKPYLASTWATPYLELDDSGERIECWVYEDQCEWDQHTIWPESALHIYEGVKR